MKVQPITFSIPSEVLVQIEDIRFAQRMPSRSAAAMEIFRAGIEAIASRQKPALRLTNSMQKGA